MMVRWLSVLVCASFVGCSWPHDVERPLEPTPECGDAYLTSDEACDDGNTIQEACDYGETTCTVCGPECSEIVGVTSFCGDGARDEVHENCDDGNESNEDGCVVGCIDAVCGDGYHRQDVSAGQPGHEGCDDGNTTQEVCDYGERACTVCDAGCQLAPGATTYCGDEVIDEANSEVCDDGNEEVELCDYGTGACEVCGAGCQVTSGIEQGCGDGVLQGEFETCDDGNAITEPCPDSSQSCQVCGASCEWVPGAYCGDGDVTAEIGEECDDMNDVVEACDHDGGPCEVCGPGCLLTAGIERSCGDGILDAEFEACDDSNNITEPCPNFTEACTVCAANCQEVPGSYCGDGLVDAEIGEVCDDGNSNDDLNGCSALCENNAECGNGVVEDVFESCDDGYTDACGDCNESCTAPGGGYGDETGYICGDGALCPAYEACDDGNELDSDGCLTSCELPGCGDGQLRLGLDPGEEGYEECDDGTVTDEGNGCTAECLRNDVCGDTLVQDLFEVCDDGYGDACGTCNEDCTGPGLEPVCGDGIYCAEFESCDDGNNITEVCEYGVLSCQTCTESCQQGSGIYEYCGDGVVQGQYEECDEGVDNRLWCPGDPPCTVCTPLCKVQVWEAGGGGGSCDGDPQVTYYYDEDLDGFGDPAQPLDCSFQPSFHVTNDLDCAPANGFINPSQSEICNGVDDNCDDVSDEGIKGTGAPCAVASCLALFDDHLPTDSQSTWLVRDGESPRQVWCDYGTVGSGWAHRRTLTITNTTAEAWANQPVAFALETGALIAAGKLQGLGQDLRVFTQDDGLVDYWYGDPVGTSSTEVWVTVAALDPGQSVDLVLAYGNPDADGRSLTLFYDRFREDSSAYYTLGTNPLSNSTFLWSDAGDGRYVADGWNDYFWMVRPDAIELGSSLYIETAAYWVDDDDGMGPAFSTSAGDYFVGMVTDDYDGTAFSTEREGIVQYSGVPAAHNEGTHILELEDVIDLEDGMRIGLWVHDGVAELLVDGVSLGVASWAGSGMQTVGLSSISNGECQFEYLWVSSFLPDADFNPESQVSVGTASLGAEEGF